MAILVQESPLPDRMRQPHSRLAQLGVAFMIFVEIAVLLGSALFVVGGLVGASIARAVESDRRRRPRR